MQATWLLTQHLNAELVPLLFAVTFIVSTFPWLCCRYHWFPATSLNCPSTLGTIQLLNTGLSVVPCKLCWYTHDTCRELVDLTQGLSETRDLLKQPVQAREWYIRISEMALDIYIWTTEVYHTYFNVTFPRSCGNCCTILPAEQAPEALIPPHSSEGWTTASETL